MRSSLYSKFLSFLRSFILLHLLTCSMLISSHQRTSLQGLPVAMLASQQAVRKQTTTCRRCKQQFVKEDNHAQACQFHTAIFTGGEISKAIGFCRASSRPEDQLVSVVGRTGIIRFWDCCGNEDPDAPGCSTGFHRGYDDPEDD